jgi:uncharacterized PurR-regulated membrane protein YhhQ (DUF165 family)
VDSFSMMAVIFLISFVGIAHLQLLNVGVYYNFFRKMSRKKAPLGGAG